MIGYELLRDLGLSPVDTYVLHHHERWDGKGYPHGLTDVDIPVGSRLILVADAFDALTSNRAYRDKVSIDAALEELQREAGRQLDPIVVAALHDHIAELRREDSATTVGGSPLTAGAGMVFLNVGILGLLAGKLLGGSSGTLADADPQRRGWYSPPWHSSSSRSRRTRFRGARRPRLRRRSGFSRTRC